MAWTKIPKEHHPIFEAAVPADPRIELVQMFGGLAAMANGYMAAGLFGNSAMVRLSPVDVAAALKLDGASIFDPMGNGRVMKDTVFLPEPVFADPTQLRSWVKKAMDNAFALPTKKKATKKRAAKKVTKKKAKR
jgi:TfoX/Sxy family transcriptional regulator of competence genes